MDSTPPPYGFLPFTQNIFLQPIPEISWLFPTFGCGYPYEIFFSKILVNTLWQHFWDTQYKNIFLFFSAIKKIFLQNLLENFTYEVLGIKIG